MNLTLNGYIFKTIIFIFLINIIFVDKNLRNSEISKKKIEIIPTN